MSTRARVGIVNADKTITSIYTHNDGYIRHHGPILLNHYNAEAKVRKLIKLGDLSRLAEELGEQHDFDSSYASHKNWCCAYGRDRSATSPPQTHENRAEKDFLSEEYAYLFDAGKWHAWKARTTSGWTDLQIAVLTERITA